MKWNRLQHLTETIPNYFKSPEFLLAMANASVMAPAFVLGWMEEFADDVFVPIYETIPFVSVFDDVGILVAFVTVTAPAMLPLSSFFLIATLFEFIEINDWHPLFTVLAIPNAILWGFCVAFLYRVIRSGDLRAARDATLLWQSGRDLTPRQRCPHCGQLMPREIAMAKSTVDASPDEACMDV